MGSDIRLYLVSGFLVTAHPTGLIWEMWDENLRSWGLPPPPPGELALAPLQALPRRSLRLPRVSVPGLGEDAQEDNMSHHDPAGCQRPICPECDAYGAGYSAGKSKAHFEVRNLDHDLDAGCGCEPCKTARIVRARRGATRHPCRWNLGMEEMSEAREQMEALASSLGDQVPRGSVAALLSVLAMVIAEIDEYRPGELSSERFLARLSEYLEEPGRNLPTLLLDEERALQIVVRLLHVVVRQLGELPKSSFGGFGIRPATD